ncbi:hypothetical protein DWY25_17350 [Holdemania filiformis]|uniref:XRE family transcriptional regulator n=1 Tax=Holdemania filiformis TaxID=61171 RepID=A0A412FFA5_9FIRM|nr:hypothetical protein [Holdemania filiformis]RGR66881.1 hypothetical protein DWY25_17350 [Holdemania filiformis]
MIQDKLKALITLSGQNQIDIANAWQISRQQLNNKIRLNSWKIDDLIKLADQTNTQLAFIDKNGNPIIKFDVSDLPD